MARRRRHRPPAPPSRPFGQRVRDFFGVFRYSRRAIELVWSTSRRLTVLLAVLTVVGGLMPAAVAYVGKLIVDGVVLAADTGLAADRRQALVWVAIEGALVVAMAACQRGLSVIRSLFRAQLAMRVNEMILEKALSLELSHFEDSEFYDKLTRARREASSRPLGLVDKTFGLVQNGISMVTYGALLLSFSGWAVLVLALAALPAFVAETRFSGEAFRLFRWRSPETRQQNYLEVVLAREDYAKEVKLFGLGPRLLSRYREIYHRLYGEDRSLTLRRGFWGYVLGLFSTAAFYGAYVWIVVATIENQITLGEMTMYLLVFRQGQSSLSSILQAVGGMYEDNLYLSNLYEFLGQEVAMQTGEAVAGPLPGDGLRFEDVTFTYPGASSPALEHVDLHVSPGRKLALVGENGSGKTTLIKLMTRLYEPDDGRILLDGLELSAWDPEVLRRRIGVIFQDFSRYQFTVGENIGSGDVDAFDDEGRWAEAGVKGMADPFIAEFDKGYHTQLGRWFRDGRELSGGQWQKVALSRAFMRSQADILVLDEPTAAMDAEAEMKVFERFRELTRDQMAIVISHRFSTVRMADEIAVLDGGRIIERGSHAELMAQGGRYARLFTMQAQAYQESGIR